MGDWFQRNPLLLLLTVLAAVLAAVVAFELGVFGGASPSGNASRRVALAEARLLPPVVAPSAEQAYPETTNRPLFTPTRRPAPTATAASAPVFARGQFVLLGVTIAGDTKIAMLREKASGRIHRVEMGKEVNGIEVSKIEPESIVLAKGDERETLNLTVQKPGAAGANPQPAAAAAHAPVLPRGPFASQLPNAAAAANPQPGFAGAVSPPAATANADADPASRFYPPAPAAGSAAAAAATKPSAAPMTPEELLARRRARRAQPTK